MLNIPEEVKTLYRRPGADKNLRIHFPNGEREDITNDDLVEESFSFTESICSRDTLKFGLCEASMVEFETVGVGNIEGCEIEVYAEIDISSLPDDFIAEYGITSEDVAFPYYRIPYGKFTVDSCPRQSDMTKRKVGAYDKLSSKSLDYDKTEQLNNYLKSKPVCVPKIVYTLEKIMLQDFNIGHERTNIPVEYSYLGDENIIYTGDVLSVDGSKDTSFEVNTQTYIFENIESTEIYDVIFSMVGLFAGKHGLLTFYQNREGFILGTNDYWWLDHGLEVELTDTNSNTLVFTEDDSVNDVLSILGYGNIAEMKFTIVSSINLAWHDENGDVQNLYSYIKSEDRETMLASISVESLRLYDIERKVIPPVLTSCTLRNVLSAVYEINGTFASISRLTGMLEEKEIKNFGLYPSEDLYPLEDLYPNEPNAGFLTQSTYISAWYDDVPTKPYGRVSTTYKNADGEEIYVYHAIVDDDTYDDTVYQTYSLSDNYLIKNCTFTAEQIAQILANVAENIKDVQYMLADVDLKGLPWIEAGDVVSIITKDSAIETTILRRTLQGIQSLRDNFESRG